MLALHSKIPQPLKMFMLYAVVAMGLIWLYGITSNVFLKAFFVWCGVASFSVGLIYILNRPDFFPKAIENKVVKSVLTAVLAPYFIFNRLMRLVQTSSVFMMSKTSSLIGSDLYVRAQPKSYKENGCLDLCTEKKSKVDVSHYVFYPMLDLIAPSVEQIQQAVELIKELRQTNQLVYVNCALGKGRSAAIGVAWLLYSDQAKTVEEAVNMVKAARDCAFLPKTTIANISKWHAIQANRTTT